MNEKITFTGGEPAINFDDLDRNNKANKNASINSFRAFGDNYIIQGVTGNPAISAGYVMLDGEILQVDAHSKTGTHFEKVTTYDNGGNKTFNDGTPRQTWAKHRATITAGSGSLAYLTAVRLGTKFVEPTTIANLTTTVIEIGDWNMNSVPTSTITVAHGIGNYKNIRSVNVIIRDDSDVNYYDINKKCGGADIPVAAGISSIDATNIVLTRPTGSFFASVNFDSTGYNRGWITVQYET